MQSVIVLCFFLMNLLIVFSTPRPGIYVDNEYDQTTMERLMSTDEKKKIEVEILTMLGLPNRPNRPNRPRKPLNTSAQKFLLDIYASFAEEDNDEKSRRKRSSDVNISGEEQIQIDESDVIMTFESSNHHVPGVRHERGNTIWFNVSDVPVAEDIVGAELKIHKTEGKLSKNPDSKYTVTVYQLINTDDGEREYVTAANTTAGFTGWLSLNVTACLSSWVAFPNSNKGLYLSVHPVDKEGHEIRPEDLGLVTVKGEDETQLFMVAFLEAVNHVKPRLTRETRTRKDTFNEMMRRNASESDESALQKSCRIETLSIKFKELQWHDWIIAPAEYVANYCVGGCNFPLNAQMNATNHAIVQTLVHLMNPRRYPKSSCAPTKLGPISVLYSVDEKYVTLKRYKKMVVKTCGCH